MLLACGLLLLGALPALAAPTWSAPTLLSNPVNAVGTVPSAPTIAIDDGGVGVEAWSETVAGSSVIRVAQHTGGTWSTLPGGISTSLPGDGCSPFASVDPSGNALVVWSQWTGPGCGAGNQTIVFSTRAAAATTWAAPQAVGTTAQAGDWQSAGASNSAGKIVIAWETTDGTNDYVFAAVGSTTTGFSAQEKLVTVPTATYLDYLTAGIGANGDAAVEWNNSATVSDIELSYRPRAGSFQASPTAVTANTAPATSNVGSIAIDPFGNTLVAYTTYDGTTQSFASRYRQANGVWQPNQALAPTTSGFLPSWVAVGMDGTGAATAAMVETNFSTPSPHTRQLWTSVRPASPTATWSTRATLSDPVASNVIEPAIAVAQSGATVVSWGVAGAQDVIQAAYRPPGGAFGALATVAAGTATSIAIAPAGDAAIAFDEATNPVSAGVSSFEVTAPTISGATVPATGTTGQAVAMSVAASDDWSVLAPAQLSWTFGDGSAGNGASVSHVFGKAGTYTVGVSAGNAAGLSGGPATRQIVISDAPVPPLPTTTVAKPVVKATWRSSKLSGSVALSGTVGITTKVTLSLRRHGAVKNISVERFATIAGKWKRTLRLPPTLAPGRYDVVVSGVGVQPSTTSFTLVAPRSGIVARSYTSGLRHGPAVTRLTGTSELWAHFKFGTLPAKGQKITTQWTLPGGKQLAANSRPRTQLVEAQVKDLSGKPLPTGRWHCTIKVGGIVVATVNVRLS
jgi:hypothetical protein